MSKFLNCFMNHDTEGDFYSLSNTGCIVLVVLIVLLVLIAAFIVDRKQRSAKFTVKRLAFAGVALALAYVTSFVKYEMPFGGSVTLFSMLFIVLIGNWYGIKIGLITAFAYSILQFLQTGGSYFLSPFQVCCDYIFAFSALGLSGFFTNRKNGLMIGYIVSVIVRGLFHVLGGYIYWMSYMPENFPDSIAFMYPFVYNYAYLLAEGILTVIILLLPPVKSALSRTKKIAID